MGFHFDPNHLNFNPILMNPIGALVFLHEFLHK